MASDNEREIGPVWDTRTGVQNLLRNRVSGRYYSRVMVGMKRRMRSLKTTIFSVAELRHSDEVAKALRQRSNIATLAEGGGDMGMLIEKLRDDYLADTTKAKSSKENMVTTMVRLVDQWEKCFGNDLRAMKPGRVTLDQARKFANFLHGSAKHERYHGKKCQLGYKASVVNTTIEMLYRVLRLAVETGAAPTLPFELNPIYGGPIRKPEIQPRIVLPSVAQMRAVFEAMRTIPDAPNLIEMRHYLKGKCAESAEYAEFMCFSGARKGEAAVFVWEDDFPGHVVLRGTKTISSRDREVPKIAALRELLERMRARRLASGMELKGRAFNISNCKQAMETACAKVGVARMTHHTLRHFFATICIESGVDIPTVSRWLGHGDGGALALRTYGHLRREHSLAAAAKVRVA